ncbi:MULTISPECIES: zinc ribbon domain-containing protein [Clostridium]|uniref:zinc ribbon domain-containing protein n=1 Tax=Clostridium TaxID=1485 RepID=UPI0005FBD18D|nr:MULTISPECIES: zinc ribbon domain-containing protein [Clostridium]MDU5722990.1 zinc ribbon domain-containing protein [Clostridium butyricum]MDU5821097.1 zinc ribbon domain-containing protein [Clostridium butyricum]
MFCKNCGGQIKEGDVFCGNCGVQADDIPQRNQGNSDKTITNMKVFDDVKIYFKNPLSFFLKMKDSNLMIKSIVLILGLPIISGIFNVFYNSAVLNSIFSSVKNLPDLLVKSGLIDISQSAILKNGIVMSNEYYEFKNRIMTIVDNKEIFVSGFFQVISLMVVTIVVIELLNYVLLKNKIKQNEILFMSSASYIPLAISIILASLVSLLSILFGILIILSGYILSFITLYSGIKEFSNESEDKIFGIMVCLFILVSGIVSFIIMKEVENSLVSIGKLLQSIESFL